MSQMWLSEIHMCINTCGSRLFLKFGSQKFPHAKMSMQWSLNLLSRTNFLDMVVLDCYCTNSHFRNLRRKYILHTHVTTINPRTCRSLRMK